MNKKKYDKNNVKYREYLMKKAALIKIAVFLAMLLCGAVISMIIPLRPVRSIEEKRNLSEFPDFGWESFMEGEYFAGIDTWFSDTFPGRDDLIKCNERFTSLYGIRNNVIHGEVVVGDEIPELDYELSEEEFGYLDNIDPDNAKEHKNTDDGVNDYNFSSDTQIKAEDIGISVDSEDGSSTAGAKAGESLGSIFVVGDSAYNYYSFSKEYSDEYINLVNNLANTLKDKATVYNMLVPTAIDITLDDATRNSINSSSQKQAILYLYSRMNKDVGKCFIYDLLRKHRDEYIYFRTDHHWTALGAYYAYSAFMTQLEKTPFTLDSFTAVDMNQFIGSYYTQTRIPSLGNNPDNLTAYIPFSTNALQMINHQNDFIDYNIITDVSTWNTTSKYSCFIGGDNPYTQINNPSVTDSSSLLIIKESFGNAFVPFVVENFENVYVIDYRYYKNTVSELVEEKGIDKVLLLNNISVTSTPDRVEELKAVCK